MNPGPLLFEESQDLVPRCPLTITVYSLAVVFLWRPLLWPLLTCRVLLFRSSSRRSYPLDKVENDDNSLERYFQVAVCRKAVTSFRESWQFRPFLCYSVDEIGFWIGIISFNSNPQDLSFVSLDSCWYYPQGFAKDYPPFLADLSSTRPESLRGSINRTLDFVAKREEISIHDEVLPNSGAIYIQEELLPTSIFQVKGVILGFSLSKSSLLHA